MMATEQQWPEGTYRPIGIHVHVGWVIVAFPFASYTHDVGRCINYTVDLARKLGVPHHEGVNVHRACRSECDYGSIYQTVKEVRGDDVR